MKRSTPSATSKSPTSPARSTTSWTIPEPTDVLSYAYLWHREAAEGREEARKDRPVVVVISRKDIAGRTELLVAPVTTQPPRNAADGIEIPARVKAHLGLDAARCWIMVTELNRFIWQGPDVRLIAKSGEVTPYYGFLPERLFDPVLKAVIARAEGGRLKMTKRSE